MIDIQENVKQELQMTIKKFVLSRVLFIKFQKIFVEFHVSNKKEGKLTEDD